MHCSVRQAVSNVSTETREHAHHRLREGLARGSDLEPSRPARACQNKARAVAELDSNPQAEALEWARSGQDPAQALRVRQRPGERRERPVGDEPACGTAPW